MVEDLLGEESAGLFVEVDECGQIHRQQQGANEHIGNRRHCTVDLELPQCNERDEHGDEHEHRDGHHYGETLARRRIYYGSLLFGWVMVQPAGAQSVKHIKCANEEGEEEYRPQKEPVLDTVHVVDGEVEWVVAVGVVEIGE